MIHEMAFIINVSKTKADKEKWRKLLQVAQNGKKWEQVDYVVHFSRMFTTGGKILGQMLRNAYVAES